METTIQQQLAEAVRDRRKELGMSQAALADRTRRLDPDRKGISQRSVQVIESGEASEQMHPGTRSLLDAALEWPPGTVHAMLQGEEPPKADVLTQRQEERLRSLEAEVAELRSTVADLIDAIRLGDRLAQRREMLQPREDETGE